MIKSSYAKDLGTTFVSLYVGPEKQHYAVHKDLLTSQSDYFDKALNGNFKEAGDNAMYLEEDDPAAIGLLIGWLYRDVIPGTSDRLSAFVRNAPECLLESTEPIPYPPNGTLISYRPLQLPDPSSHSQTMDVYQHITADATYSKFSQEELRIADYDSNRKFGPGPAVTNTGLFGAPGVGAAPAAPATTTLFPPPPAPPAQPSSSMTLTSGSLFSAPSFAPSSPLFSSNTLPNSGFSLFSSGGLFGSRAEGRSGPFAKKAELSPNDFGYHPTIIYPRPEGQYIDGIPRSEPFGNTMEDEDTQQDALLNLCIFAETICWPRLYNAAVDAYVKGELNLLRNIPVEHVDLIYQRTHSDSTLRDFVIDSLRRLNNADSSYKVYLPLALIHEDFLEAVFYNHSTLTLEEKEPVFKIKKKDKSYHMPHDTFVNMGSLPKEEVFSRKGKEAEGSQKQD